MTHTVRPRTIATACVRVAMVLLMVGLGAPGLTQTRQPAQTSSQPSCQEALSGLYTRISPTVVAIAATSVNPYAAANHVERVSGSGVIIDGAGLVLTNSHVVFGRQVMMVTLDDGTTLQAKPVGADPLFDIALIRIPPPPKGLHPAATLGDSDKLLVGEEVLAIGNPFGLDQTLTRGIISAVNRLLPGSSLSLTEPLIQTDAAINPGSSGGPLVNRCGEVVGITTALLPEAQSIGFAIPSNLIKSVVPALVSKGRLVRPWFGVQGQFVVPALKELLRVPLVDGFLVEVVEPDSPADQAGVQGGDLDVTVAGGEVLLGGDIVTMVNGAPVAEPAVLGRTLSKLSVGDKVRMTVFHDNATRDVEIVLVPRPLLPGDIAGRSGAGEAGGAAGVRGPGAVRRLRFAFEP
jgi:serine protease Do